MHLSLHSQWLGGEGEQNDNGQLGLGEGGPIFEGEKFCAQVCQDILSNFAFFCPVSTEKCPNHVYVDFRNNTSHKNKHRRVFYFYAKQNKISSNHLKISGFSAKNVRYPRYQDTDFLQLCSISLETYVWRQFYIPFDQIHTFYIPNFSKRYVYIPRYVNTYPTWHPGNIPLSQSNGYTLWRRYILQKSPFFPQVKKLTSLARP